MKAAILILKQATFLRLASLEPESALDQAELDYQTTYIDLKVMQYLVAIQWHSVNTGSLSKFIMATNIGLPNFTVVKDNISSSFSVISKATSTFSQ